MQAMHGRLSEPGSDEALQHFITDLPWEAELLWARLRAIVPVRTGIVALDDTSLPKQGTHSVGVKRQYGGALGKIANGPVAVSTVLLDDQLAWPLSFELYLPTDWLADASRRAKARIPAAARVREKWRIALSTLGNCSGGLRRRAADFHYRCEANHLTVFASRPSISVTHCKNHQIDRATSRLRHSSRDVEGAPLHGWVTTAAQSAPAREPLTVAVRRQR